MSWSSKLYPSPQLKNVWLPDNLNSSIWKIDSIFTGNDPTWSLLLLRKLSPFVTINLICKVVFSCTIFTTYRVILAEISLSTSTLSTLSILSTSKLRSTLSSYKWTCSSIFSQGTEIRYTYRNTSWLNISCIDKYQEWWISGHYLYLAARYFRVIF